uniref:D-glutamate cyclase n=1 Tax=Leptobrachium leishanense TaxID=445787 RepID=A0A8C5WKI6_9ANUR
MMYLQRLRFLAPAAVRGLIRHNKINATNTSGMSTGFNQANVVILHKSLADDFEKFCRANSGPLPLLFRSAPGEWSSPPLSQDSDIRTDCLQYRRYENGVLSASPSSLESYTEQMKDMVTFYLGCSFSFESAVEKLGVPVRNVEQGCNISMYKTAIPCSPVGKFSCNLVVTMRPIPLDKLGAAVRATQPMKKYHGAPVHIGSSESPLAFTHSPGCMFITDTKNEDAVSVQDKDIPEVLQISSDPLHYSLASRRAAEKIRELENIIGIDPGNRGIKHLLLKDELLKSSLSLSHAKSVLITTGFPTHFQHNPPEETDGPPGAIAMASMLLALGKHVAIVTDERAMDLYKTMLDSAAKQGIIQSPVPLLCYKEDSSDSAIRFLCENGNPETPKFDHLVAIERTGRASDGNYYNARKINIKHMVDPIDNLFVTAQKIQGITTTGIGDGGNELGMGKVKQAVREHIRNGDTIACDVAADYAIIAGVSNWGGYAVSCALYLLNTCEIHDRYLRKAVGYPKFSEGEVWTPALPSVSKEEKMLSILVGLGVRSGVSGNLGMEVDGLLFHNAHSEMIEKILGATI